MNTSFYLLRSQPLNTSLKIKITRSEKLKKNNQKMKPNFIVDFSPTEVTAPGPFGQVSSLLLSPGIKNSGWVFSSGCGDQKLIVPIGVNTVCCNARSRNLSVVNGKGENLRVLEHILPLKFLGLTDLEIKLESHVSGLGSLFGGIAKGWPPYIMPTTLWEFLTRLPLTQGDALKWQTIKKVCQWSYPNKRDGKEAFTKIEPSTSPTLTADIRISYPGLGTGRRFYDLSQLAQGDLLRIMSVGPQGWYRPIWFFKNVARLLRLPAYKCVEWPNMSSEEGRRETISRFLDHRFFDLLGAIALLAEGDCLPAVHVTSVCSGHFADLQVVKMAELGAIVS